MSITGAKNLVRKPLTGPTCQGISTSVKSNGHISLNIQVPERAAELRSGDARKASFEPHISAALSGCFSAHVAGSEV